MGRVSFGGDNDVLKLDRGDGCTLSGRGQGSPTYQSGRQVRRMSYYGEGLREGMWLLHLPVAFSTEQKLFLTHSQPLS